MLLMILAGSCARSDGLQVTPSREVAPTTPAIKFSSAIASSFTPTLIEQSATSTSTLTIVPTLTSSPSQTSTIIPTALPTLSVEAARNRLQDMLANNGDCLLSCLWGITPGVSSSHDARIILEPLSSISDLTHFSSERGTIYLLKTEGDLIISTNVMFLTYPTTEIVSRITYQAKALKALTGENGVIGVFDSAVFGEQLSLYMLPQILSQYGRPSSVMLTTLAEPPPQSRGGDIGYFRIILLYPDQGILVRYITQIHVVGQYVLGCPTNAHIELELYPAGSGDSFFENLDPSLQEDIRNNYKPLEEVTSMSIDNFYQTFRQPTDECLKTPTNLWPIPEQ